MRRIFGANWAALRGGGGRARGGGKRAAQNAPGLTVPHDAQLLLHPCNRPNRVVARDGEADSVFYCPFRKMRLEPESFISRHKSEVRKVIRHRALERHKAGKHQVELAMAHFRNVFHAQRYLRFKKHGYYWSF
eukprot:IDg582t1